MYKANEKCAAHLEWRTWDALTHPMATENAIPSVATAADREIDLFSNFSELDLQYDANINDTTFREIELRINSFNSKTDVIGFFVVTPVSSVIN